MTSGSSAYNNTTLNGIPFIYTFGTDTLIIAASYGNYYHVSYDGAVTWNVVTPSFLPGVNTTYGDMIYRMNFFTPSSYFEISGDQFGPKGLYINNQSGSSGPVGIQKLNFDNIHEALVLFPNPSQSHQQIFFSKAGNEAEVNIFNMNGQLVKSLISMGSFMVEDLNQGIYIVRVKEKDKTWRSAKLIIQ